MESAVRNRSSRVRKVSDDVGSDVPDSKPGEEKFLFHVVLLLRIINVFLVQTSFMPDEYWQTMEVAHRSAFGQGHLTWEWQVGLRSFLYPAAFSVAFSTLQILGLDSANAVIYLPRIMQAIFSAVGDWNLYLFARAQFGRKVATFTLVSHMLSWFWWYCSSRTFTNTVEAAMLCMGLNYYPWPSSSAARRSKFVYQVVAVLISVIRPTAAVVWVPMALWHILREKGAKICSTLTSYILLSVSVLTLATVVDMVYYKTWVFVHWNFFIFNVWEHKCGWFGSHPWHWYLSQGVPAVVGTQGLFFVLGLHQTMGRHRIPNAVHKCLFAIFISTIVAYSALGHKEFRYILQVVPIASVFCGISLASMSPKLQRYSIIFLLLTNVPVALYTGLVHQAGTLRIMDKLRASLDARCSPACHGDVLILAPCHTTPLYSHIHANLSVRFLTCFPNLKEEETYTSETELFYENPHGWLKDNVDERNVLPHHIIMFDILYEQLGDWKNLSEYTICATSFNTHFPEERNGKNIHLLCRNDIA